jgi:two-component system response regulator HydG
MSNTGRILVVDDDEAQVLLMKTVLEADGWTVLPATSGAAAIAVLDGGEEVDVILTDLLMPGMSGSQLLAAVQERSPEVPVIIMTAHASIDSAVELLHAGAHHYLEKPTKLPELRITVRKARDATLTRRELARLKRRVDFPADVVGISRPVKELLEAAIRVAPTGTPVLITGESGTGKEVVARAIHAASGRQGFTAFNIAAIPHGQLEAELAAAMKAATTGTLFLDEVADLPLALQPRLVRFLEDGTWAGAPGAAGAVKSGARVIATMRQDPRDLVEAGRLRGELLYRLGIVHLHLPPLRERPVDIPALATHLLGRLADRFQLEPADLGPEALAAISAYQWPGNTRELENVLARALALRSGRTLGLKDLPPQVARAAGGGRTTAVPVAMLTLEEVERRHILQVLERTGGNKLKAAEVLGIDRSTLHRKLKQIEGLAALQL